MGQSQSREDERRNVQPPRDYHEQQPRTSTGYSSGGYQNYPPSYQSYDDAPVDAYPPGYSYPPPQVYPSQPSYPAHQAPTHPSQLSYPAHQAPTHSVPMQAAGRRLDRRYSLIADNYSSLNQVTDALAKAGLESSNLIVGIDFTKSNEWTGKHSFNRHSLHHIGDTQNPYEHAISIIGRTLSRFDEDNLIPCFGFGDATTHDQDVFSFYPDERPCNGFSEALTRYTEIVPHLRLAGPTSFAPVIEMAMTIVKQSGGQYHVLLIIADGQVTRSVDTESGQLSPQEQKTVDAIVKASEFPLSIILVGVGDGPWDMMKEFDDNIPARSFDNFQFVNFTSIMTKNIPQTRKETEFALAALMEIPSQYKATIELGILGRQSTKSPDRVPLPPPMESSISFEPTSFQFNPYLYPGHDTTSTAPSASYSGYEPPSTAPPAPSASWDDNRVCPICLTNPKDMAFGCGHQTCCECGANLSTCPICRRPIETRIKLY